MKTDLPKDVVALAGIMSKSAYYRGRIIDISIKVESAIDLIIGKYLSPENEDKFGEILIIIELNEGISFHTKTSILSYVVRNYFQDYLKIDKNYFKDLEELKKVRNIFAHRKTQTSPKDIEAFDNQTIFISIVKTEKGKLKFTSLKVDEKYIDDKMEFFRDVFLRTQKIKSYIETKGDK